MKRFRNLHNSLSFRLILLVGLILLISFTIGSYTYINYLKRIAVEEIIIQSERLGDTIKLGTKYAMMLNAGDEINQIIGHISQQKIIENIRIYNKKGEIKYSNNIKEIGRTTDIQSEACHICHETEVPLDTVALPDRTRIVESSQGSRLLGIISPVYNEPGCSTSTCHAHPGANKILGSLDVIISLSEINKGFISQERGIIAFAIVIFLLTSVIIGFFIIRFINRPINELIAGTKHIGNGEYGYKVRADRNDEIGQLAMAVNRMGEQIGLKQDELNKQKEEYRALFENAPCYITVQDRNYKLLRYNRDFAEQFNPEEGQHCYEAYKGRSSRCEICPVSETFKDGKPHTSEESGTSKDGTSSVWMVRTSPIMNSRGEVVAAMEMCLDLTLMRFLEDEARKSEEKYHTIFDTSPNPIFVLDANSLEILDCNNRATNVYGYRKKEILNKSFLDLFEKNERQQCAAKLKTSGNLAKARQIRKDGETIYVNIYTSSSEYMEREVLLVTTSDITDRLLAEQHLIQAGKMATLGEMATGMAHELNQPLSVIKTASNFFLKKIRNREPIKEDIMETLAEEMDSHVDRASKIINHMREFGRQSDAKKEEVRINRALQKALEIFSRQLELREIDVSMDLQEDLPIIMADSNRLEQVFINLLTNARDAIEDRWAQDDREKAEKKISITSRSDGKHITVEIRDTGTGLPESMHSKIFDPFFTTKKAGSGTGLGLSISYGIVRDYGGTIKVESNKNQGSTFILKFPV